MPRPRNTDEYIAGRFMSLVTVQGDCWIWLGPRNHAGYPQFSPHGDTKEYATRWAYTRWVAPLGKGERIVRTCGQDGCVAPLHHRTRTIEDRLWERVDRRGNDECWPFSPATHKGYGRVGAAGRRGVLAHRLAYELLVGPIPDGLTLDHLCENTACVNPAHLEPVTQSENSRRYSLRHPRTTGARAGRTTKPAPATLADALN